jgi:hypothetical protein
MATVKKAQMGKSFKKKAIADSVESEMNPGKMIPKEKSNYATGRIAKMLTPPKKKVVAAPKNKMKEGGSLGMKSVKAGYDKNPGVTRADIIVAAKKEAKSGAKMKKAKSGAALKKQAAVAIAMKKAGKAPKKAMGGMKMMKGGGKCKYGC